MQLKAGDGAGNRVNVNAHGGCTEAGGFDDRRAAPNERIEHCFARVIDTPVICIPEIIVGIEFRGSKDRTESGAESPREPAVGLVYRHWTTPFPICQYGERFNG
jgi:hypothetical protein